MYVVGLTGGIGTGKSTVSDLFAELGVDIIDTDKIARDVVQSGTPALEKIVEHFGDKIVNSKGELKRKLLREKIFANPKKKEWLESLLHPLIREEMQRRVKVAKPPYCIVVIPLLFETGFKHDIDRILVVDSTSELQIERVMQRDDTTGEEVEKIMRSQISSKAKCESADDIIENNGSIEDLRRQVKYLDMKYRESINVKRDREGA